MSERQQRVRGQQPPRRGAIAVANENEATTRHLMHSNAERKGLSLGTFKNQSVLRAFAILKAFYSPDEWVAACELSRRARISEATVNRFMHSLADVGAVVRAEDGKYRCVLFVMSGMHGRPIMNSRELA